MMSAKTVLTDAPAATTPSATGGAAPAAPGAEATPFQNLLAATAPPVVDLSFVDTLPTQAMPQLVLPGGAKPQPGKPAAGPLQTAGTPAQSPQELLQLLDAALLPESGDTVGPTAEDLPEDFAEQPLDGDASKEDILADWLDAMVPYGVFAPQAGSDQTGEAPEKGAGGQDSKATAIPASLVPQALVPDDGKAPVTPNNANLAPVVNLAAAAQNAASVLAPHTDKAERDSSASDWMNSLGDASAKRAHDAAPATAARIAVPVHDARWADAIAHRLVMMARDGESVAQLKLVPQDLGPLDIQITVRDSEANVHFGAANAETRSVLESSIPRLREMLSAQGLQLANASVSQHSAGHDKPERSSGPAAVGAVAEEADAGAGKVVSTALLDVYV